MKIALPYIYSQMESLSQYKFVNVNVNVKDTFFWLSPTIESCN